VTLTGFQTIAGHTGPVVQKLPIKKLNTKSLLTKELLIDRHVRWFITYINYIDVKGKNIYA